MDYDIHQEIFKMKGFSVLFLLEEVELRAGGVIASNMYTIRNVLDVCVN